LLLCQPQENPTPPDLYCVIDGQAGVLASEASAPLHELDYLVRGLEVQLPGQGNLQILLQKLAMPAIPELEGEAHPMALFLRTHGTSAGEETANKIHITACRGE